MVVIDLITSPVVSWRECETPPQYRVSAVILCMTPSEVSGAGGGPSYLFFGKYWEKCVLATAKHHLFRQSTYLQNKKQN